MNRFWIASLALFTLSTAVRADQTQDMVVGNGTPGPFALSWKQITHGSESVQIDTLAQVRGLDYSIDSEAGTVTFTRPLPPQSAAEVRYRYDPRYAVRTGAGFSAPVSFDLAHGEHGSLSLDALYKRNGSVSDTDPGALSVGLGGGWQGGSTRLTTRLLFAPSLSAQDAAQGPNGLARTGLAVGGTSDPLKIAHFSFGYSRVGVALTGTTGDDGWQVGTQALTFGSRLTPSRQVLATFDYTQADPFAPNSRMNAQYAGGLTVTPSDAIQLQTHWTQASASNGTTEGEDLSVTAKPNAKAEVDASVASQTAPGSQSTQSVNLAAKVTPTATSQINASFAAQNAPGSASDTQTMNLATQVAAGKAVTLSADAGQSRLGAATTDNQVFGVVVSPKSQMQLHSSLALRQTDQFATTAATFGGTVQPAAFLQFSANYTSRLAPVADTAAQDTLDSSSAQIALSPLKGFRLTGNYAQNPDGGGTLQRLAQRGIGLETTLGAVSLSGDYGWTRQYDTPTVGTTLNLGLGLRLSRALQISGGYKQTLTVVGLAPTGASLYTFGLTHTLGDRFNLSLNGTMQQTVGQAAVAASPDYTANANLGMKF